MKFKILFPFFIFLLACTERPISIETTKNGTIEHFSGYNKIVTDQFSVELPNKWNIEVASLSKSQEYPQAKEGAFFASKGRSEPYLPFLLTGFIVIPRDATIDQDKVFQQYQKEFTLQNYIQDKADREKSIAGMMRNSSWHSTLETVRLSSNLTVDRIDIEMTNSHIKGHELENNAENICLFARQYHAPKVNMYFSLILDKKCEAARPEFEVIEKAFVWKQ